MSRNSDLAQTLRTLVDSCVQVDTSLTADELWSRPDLREALIRAERFAADTLQMRSFDDVVRWARLTQLSDEVAEGLEQARRGELLEGREVRQRLLAKSRSRRETRDDD